MGSGVEDVSCLINLRAEPAPEFAQPKSCLISFEPEDWDTSVVACGC